ncbi:hypothetical protein TNCV_4085771 [Trichonephila clavipes]|nr:hypothetical protein TNCV_4085771 [Trichonephila clavipes]
MIHLKSAHANLFIIIPHFEAARVWPRKPGDQNNGACRELKPSTAEDIQCRVTSNLSMLKCPPVGVVVRRGGASSGVVI